jgi:homoserine kinase
MPDAVFNLQHALLFVHAVSGGQRRDLREALPDRWHQGVRVAPEESLALS